MPNSANPYEFLKPADATPRGNVTNQVTSSLRDAIVRLDMPPGELIDKMAICKRIGVSRFPVSDALGRLQAEGLVDIQPQRGTSVSLIRIADVSEFMLIRKAIEAEAVHALVLNKTPDLQHHLDACLDAQRTAAAENDRDKFHQYDCEFHELLFAAMQFGKIKAIIDSARANVDRARRLINSPRRLALTVSEHEAIYNAIVADKPDQAAAAMRQHIEAVMKELLAFAAREPQHFADGDYYAKNHDIKDTEEQ